MKNNLVRILIFLVLVSLLTSVSMAKEYGNVRFGFAISIPDSWFKYRNPPPANNDGISFSLPGKAVFSASGSYNVMNRSLDGEVKERIGDEKVLKKTRLKLDGQKAIVTLTEKKGIRTLMAVVIKKMKDGDEIIYSIYYSAPIKVYSKYQAGAEDSMATFRFLKAQGYRWNKLRITNL